MSIKSKTYSNFSARLLVLAGMLGVTAAQAQAPAASPNPAANWPSRAVRVIVAATPGGGTDVLARLFAQRLQERLAQPFVVENRGGNGGSIAADVVAKATPDGYTWLMTNDQFTANAAMTPKLPYDPLKDLAPVVMMGRTPVVLGVGMAVPAKSVSELVALVRANPGKYAYSSCGNGTPLHFAGELLNLSAKLDLAHAPYKGCAPALVDVVSGAVPVFFNMLGNAVPYEKSGKLRLLGVASLQRLTGFPDLPTVAEQGFPAFEAFPWYGLLAPGATPRELIHKLNAEVSALVNTPDISERLRAIQFVPATGSPESFGEVIRSDLARWSRVARDAKIGGG